MSSGGRVICSRPSRAARCGPDRVWRVLGHLADHGPTRTRDIAAVVGAPFQSMNALVQQLKRRGMVCKAGDEQLSPHGITELGRSVLAELRRRGTGQGGTVGTRQAAC